MFNILAFPVIEGLKNETNQVVSAQLYSLNFGNNQE